MSSHTSKAKGELLTALSNDQPFSLVNFDATGKSESEIESAWKNSQLILLDGINPALSNWMFNKYQPLLERFADVPVISLGDIDNPKMNQGLTPAIRHQIAAYFQNAGQKNYRNMMKYLSTAAFKLSHEKVESPHIVPKVGLYHTNFKHQVTQNSDAFFQWLAPQRNQSVIGIAIHRSVVDYQQQQIVDAIIAGLELKGAKAFGFFFEGEDEELTWPELLTDQQGNAKVDLIINYRALHYVEKRRKEFEQIGVPIIHALNYGDGDAKAFEKDNAGISASLTPFFLVMPEDTGSTDPVIISAHDNGRKVVMQEQLNALIERAYNHSRLKHIANSDKRIATFIWNYPPGEKNIGAAFLDVPSSLTEIVKSLKAQGYRVTEKDMQFFIDSAGELLRPYYRQENSAGLIEKNLADYLPLSVYQNWFNQLPDSVKQPIVERWGMPADNFMLTDHQGEQAFVIPRIQLGNFIVLPQGVRGENPKEHASLYHSTKTPVNHAYLALYLYTREVFKADAYIHLGTHGSQEWLTGKERGLSVWDAPNLAIGYIPVFYPYIIDNVGEAMQAKRRGRATIISHLTPGFAKAGLYADVAQLNELLTNYLMLEAGQTKANTQAEILKIANELNILKDLGIEGLRAKTDAGSEAAIFTQKFDDNISKIQDHLKRLADQSQPLGVHTFGTLPKDAHLYSTLLQMLGEDFAKRASDYEKAQGLSIKDEQAFDQRGVKKLPALDGYQLLQAKIEGRNLKGLSDQLSVDLAQATEYWKNFQQIAEINNLVSALSGKYIPVSHGNDPIRNPEAVPTGRNLIGFNPARVPSKEAFDAGATLMQQTIDDYHAKHGRYPEKLAFSLWSLETMRHQGALESQILYALGVQPKWNKQGNISELEIIPYETLKRPRIDVVISATGLYRDAFPNVMLRIADAIDKVAKLKESYNYVYRNSNALKASLLEQGKSEEDATYLSTVRIFSNESGNYGTGLAGASLASDTWETDDKLANLYLDRMGFAFGKDESRWSERVSGDGIYKQVLSGTEGVIFSRSTNLYALLTNDDPFQYFGGIGLAVRSIDGKTPDMYVSNLRRKDQLKAQTMQDFLNQEMRSRYFHPRWIEAMQASGYAGATAIVDRVNNLWGWEVMTPDAVRDDHWQMFFSVYVEDKYALNMREFFEQANAEALAQIIERMLEAVRKGYWNTDAATIQKMVDTYTDLANTHDIETDNKKFTDYINEQAAGFGLAPLMTALAQSQMSTTSTAAQKQQVSGQQLQQVEQTSSTKSKDLWVWLIMLTIFATGFIAQLIENDKQHKPDKGNINSTPLKVA